MKLLVLLACSLFACTVPAWAQEPMRPPIDQAAIDALNRAHEGVVGVLVRAAPGARSAETLGRQRAGSGVVIGDDGLVLTIGYLILEADTIQIVTKDSKVVPAAPVGYDVATGFGLVRPLLPLAGIAPVPLGSHAALATGEALMVATGGGNGGVAITRLVSKRSFSGYWEYHIEAALFTSPPVSNHSGAPLFNQRGELLGIGSLFVGNALGDERPLPGNMYVPIDLLKPILSEMRQTGSSRQSRRPWLGVTSTEQGGRVSVLRVNKDSPAEISGVQPGDVVLAVDGTRVNTLESFYKAVWARPNPEDEIALVVLQGSEIRKIVVKPVDRMSTIAKPSGI